MSNYVWRRQVFTSATTHQGQWWIDAIPAGTKYVRCHFRWGFYGDTPFHVDYASYAEQVIMFGLCTTYGNGSETPPNAFTHSNDVSPPAQRWVYWEGRGVYPTALSYEGGVVTWKDTGGTEATDTKAMVLAAAPPAGQSLNLWASWAMTTDWSGDAGNSALFISISDLSFHPS